jgi:hypothetical protein
MASITGTVTTIGDPTDWIATAFDADTHAFAGAAAVVLNSYTITGLAAGKAYVVSCRPKTGPAWSAGHETLLNDYSVPTSPATTPYIFKATTASGESFSGNTVLLLNCNGNNGATAFTDAKGHAITPAGDAKISTAQSKFGGASCLLDGTGDYLDCGDSADFELGSGDFTLESWVRFTGYSNSFGGFYAAVLVGKDQIGARAFHWKITGTSNSYTAIVFSTAGTELTVNYTFSLDTWYHLAVCKSGTTLRFFVNGTQAGANQTHNTTIADVATALTVGAHLYTGYTYALKGYMDSIRITKAARYTADFTEPASEFTLNALTGSSEPIWPTTLGATVADGDVIWTNKGRFIRPLMHGPLIAV